MIEEKYGDLLQSECLMICHQVNLEGVFGGGIARQIGDLYPKTEAVVRLCEDKGLGKTVFTCEQDRIIANCFSQRENFDTDYEAVKTCFERVKKTAHNLNLKKIGVPYHYGCGIAHGDWNKVFGILKELFENDSIILEIWRL